VDIFTFMIISRNTHSEYVMLFHGNNNYAIAPQRCVIRTSPVLSKFVRAKFHTANRRKGRTDCTRIFLSLEICIFFSVSETNMVQHHTALKTVIALFWVHDTVLIRKLLSSFGRKLLHRNTCHDHVNINNSEHDMTTPSLNPNIFQFVTSSI
jgi:hypothetical protein